MLPFMPIANGGNGHIIENSLRPRDSASPFMSFTPTVGGNTALWTLSRWMKKSAQGKTQYLFGAGPTSTVNEDAIWFDAADKLNLRWFGATRLISNRLFRDPNAHGHLVVRWQSASTPKCLVYWNNELLTWGTDTVSSVTSVQVNTISVPHFHFRAIPSDAANQHFVGNDSELIFVDGQSLAPSSFAEYDADNNWVPLDPTALYAGIGTNGYHLPYSDPTSTATIGHDVSGNANHWATSGISVTPGVTYDVMKDTPTNGYPFLDTGAGGELPGNYCTLNLLDYAPGIVTSNGNLRGAGSGTVTTHIRKATMSATFPIYFEATVSNLSTPGNARMGFGICAAALATGGTATSVVRDNGVGYDFSGTTVGSVTGANFADGDVYAVAADPVTGKWWFGKVTTGTVSWYLSGDPVAGTGQVSSDLPSEVFPYMTWTSGSGGTGDLEFNFGQRPWAASNVPAGFKALCTANLPDPAIPDPALHADVAVYAGNGSVNSVTGIDFTPDFSWLKSRSAAGAHVLTDSVRGVNAQLFSNLASVEGAQADQVTAFNADGISLGANIAGTGSVNLNATSYVGWFLKAGGAAVSNTNGSLTSSVSANQAAGFSVVGWSGTNAIATIGHGLLLPPELVIYKSRLSANGGVVYHKKMNDAGYYLALNSTVGQAADAGAFNSIAPSSTVLSVGGNNNTNFTGANSMVAWCFHSVAGYCKVGSFLGNGVIDGPFEDCGFRPRFILIKYINGTGSWFMLDAVRSTYNEVDIRTFAEDPIAEANSSVVGVDFVSNGFKIRSSNAQINTLNGTYGYVALAENPFKTARAR